MHGLVLGDSREFAYQMLTSTGGGNHDYFLLDGRHAHFYFLPTTHQGGEFRHKSVPAPACVGQICGLGLYGYEAALSYFLSERESRQREL